jgi:predicted DNA binding CopG/RHH family protein
MSQPNPYTDEELEIIKYIEEGNTPSHPNLKERKKEIAQVFKNTISTKRAINIRVLEHDLSKIRSKAIREGVPYQTLIGSVLHKYANDDLVSR